MSPRFVISESAISRYWAPKEKLSGLWGDEEKKARRDEVYRTDRQLEELLLSIGFMSNRKAGLRNHFDFYQNEDTGWLRYIGFEMTDRKMIQKDVLEKIAGFLQKLQHEYCVRISNDFDDSIELFLIAVTKDTVYGQFETIETALAFGFDPTPGDIGTIR